MSIIRTQTPSVSLLDGRLTNRIANSYFQRESSPRFDDYSGATEGTTLVSRNGGKSTSGAAYSSWYVASPSGPLGTTADTTISVRPDGSPEVRFNNSGADYYWTTATHDIDESSMTFAFRGGSTKLSGVAMAISKNTGPSAIGDSGTFGKAIHVSISPDIMRISLTNGTGSPSLLSFESGDVYTTTLGLPVDGTPVTVIAKRTARDRIRFIIPGYYDTEVVDSRIPSWWGSTVGVEHFRPLTSVATDAEPLIMGWRAGVSGKRSTSMAPAAGLGGMPGGVPGGPIGVVSFAAGTTRYFPIDPPNAITLNSLSIEVTVAAAAGSKASFAILSAGADWQPKALIQDLGLLATDAVAVPTLSSINLALAGRRLLVGMRMDVAATLRYMPYTIPGFPITKPTITASPFAQDMRVTETYASSWPATPTTWTSFGSSAVPGLLCPIVLAWSET